MKVKAMCTCEECGKIFAKIANKKSTDAENWIKWAEENYILCDDCSKQAWENLEIKEAAEVKEMHYTEYKAKYSECKTVSGSYDADTKAIKVIISPRKAVKIKIAEAFPEMSSSLIDIYMSYFYDDDLEPDDEEEAKICEFIQKYK